jgi:maleate isomerase
MAIIDYGARGRIGVLTPQANPTVEPEFQRLLPADMALYTARLTSGEADASRRLIAYFTGLEATVAQFGGMKLAAIGFACTGSSYLVDPNQASDLLAAASARAKAPVIAAADAILARLRELAATRLALISPYPDWLNDSALAYWRGQGFHITATARVGAVIGDTGGIYELGTRDAVAAAQSLKPGCADAVLVTGTGLPSLSILPTLSDRLGCPVLSSNQCLAEAVIKLVQPMPAADAV